jgi:putative Holliday junction resolvase
MPDERAKPQGTIISFDFGFRRIGVAVGQTLTGSANALTVVLVANQPDWQAITRLLDEWKPAACVVGLPLAEDGGETDMSKRARKFGRQLEGRYSVSVWFEDERLTSFNAEERFIDARARGDMRRKDASLKDAIAAQIILESWLQS